MKALLFLLLVVYSSVVIFGQDLEITKKYAGILYTGNIDEKINVINDFDYMFGLEAKYSISSENFFIYRVRYSNPEQYFGSFWFENNSCGLKTKIGLIPRQITLIRPTPISSASHFEPFPYGKIPGVVPGFDVSLNGNNLSVGIGYTYSQKQVGEANLGMGFKNENFEIRLGTFYNKFQHGVAGEIVGHSFFKFMTFFESDSLLTNFLSINGPVDLYFASIYDYREKDPERVEVGLTKDFMASELNGLIGAGYDTSKKIVKIYFWIYFQ